MRMHHVFFRDDGTLSITYAAPVGNNRVDAVTVITGTDYVTILNECSMALAAAINKQPAVHANDFFDATSKIINPTYLVGDTVERISDA